MIATQSKIITSETQIAPGVIVNSDINASAAIAGSKLQALSVGANAGVIPSTGVANAHVSATAAIADTKLDTIATAGKVSGAALTSLGSIPAGAGQIPSANLTTDWQNLGSADLSGGAASSLTLSGLSARKFMRFYIFIDAPANGQVSFTFNNNGGAVYSYKYLNLSASGSGFSGSTSCNPFQTNYAVDTAMVIDVCNTAAGQVKPFWVNTMTFSNDGGAMCGGGYNDTTNQITRIDITNSGGNMGTGTIIRAYGSAD